MIHSLINEAKIQLQIFLRFVHIFYTNCSGSRVQIPSGEAWKVNPLKCTLEVISEFTAKKEIFGCLKLNKCMNFTFHYYSFWVQGAFLAQSLKARNQNHNGQIRASIRPKSFLNSSVASEHWGLIWSDLYSFATDSKILRRSSDTVHWKLFE